MVGCTAAGWSSGRRHSRGHFGVSACVYARGLRYQWLAVAVPAHVHRGMVMGPGPQHARPHTWKGVHAGMFAEWNTTRGASVTA